MAHAISHIGIIMDGNRRWAKSHTFELHRGHDKGADIFGHVCQWCLDHSVPYLTVYAFSTENWQRNSREIRHLFSLMEKYFVDEKDNCVSKGIRIKIIGERTRFDARTISVIQGIEEATQHCTKLVVQIALSYGGRDEIVRATKAICRQVQLGKLNAENITEEIFANALDTAGTPDVDLVIRTGGAQNHRSSNFLPWQTVYAEWFFSDLMWPEFCEEEFLAALEYYHTVQRKLGK